MGPRIHLAEAGNAVVGIDLRRLQRTMAHQLLDLAHVCSPIHQVGRKGVPQYVGAFFTLHAPLRQSLLHHAVDRRTGYANSFTRLK